MAGNFTTLKYNSSGVQQWIDHYSTSGTGSKNKGTKIILDKSQNLYAIGTVASNHGDIAVVKYNADGEVWSHNYEPYWFGSDVDFGVDICADTLGNFYATGQITSLDGNLWDSYFIKCDSNGSKIFEEDYTSGSGDDFPTAVAVTSAGNFFAQTNSYNFFGSQTYDIFTINYLNNGNQNWISRYNNSLYDATDFGTFLKVDEAGNQYLCGTSDAGSNQDMVALKQNVFGTHLWDVTYNGTANGNDTAISESSLPNGFVVVTAKCEELLGGNAVHAIVTMVIDSGTIVWTDKFYGSESNGAVPKQMITDADGNIYICGFETLTNGSRNGCIIRYDINGNLQWNISYDAGTNLDESFNSISLDLNNNILVTGQSFNSPTNSNYVTVKFANYVTGMGMENLNPDMLVYPNPATSAAILVLYADQSEDVSISILNISGREAKTITQRLNPGTNKINLDLSGLNNGSWFICLKSHEKSFVKKITIAR